MLYRFSCTRADLRQFYDAYADADESLEIPALRPMRVRMPLAVRLRAR